MPAKYTPEKRIMKFWERVDRSNGPDSCWNWTGTKDQYGKVYWDGCYERAHRKAYELTYGNPGDKLVCHKCDNPLCCNPSHLFLGTHQDNSDDMIRKGREAHVSGERNGNAKLLDSEAAEILYRYSRGGISQPKLAREYHVSQATIWNVVNGRRKS